MNARDHAGDVSTWVYLWRVSKSKVTTDAKMERLLNLALALLGSRRFITKSELLSAIPGYEGAPDARDRMFERDKDELRALGIEIEVRQLDALFDDEVGYRIRSDSYRNQLPKLTAEEGLIAGAALSMVALLRRDEGIRKTQIKLDPLIDSQSSPLNRILDRQGLAGMVTSTCLPSLLKAIHQKSEISFRYERDGDGSRAERHIEPYKLFLHGEEWFLYGFDRDRNAERLFHLDNILGEIELLDAQFAPPEHVSAISFDQPMPTEEIICRVPEELGQSLILEGGEIMVESSGTVDVRFRTMNRDRLLRILLSIHPRIEVLSPDEAVLALDECRQRLLNAI